VRLSLTQGATTAAGTTATEAVAGVRGSVAVPFPDGSEWTLAAGGAAAEVIDAVGWSMRLPVAVPGPVPDAASEDHRGLVVGRNGRPLGARPPSSERDRTPPFDRWSSAGRAAGALAVRASLCRPVLLVHGALVVRGETGVLLAGGSGAGKTTLAGLAPRPWRAWSDDLSAVALTDDGRVVVQPWPTWSGLTDDTRADDHPARADVARRAILRGVCFLERGDVTLLEEAAPTHAVSEVLRSAAQATGSARLGDTGIDWALLRAAWLDTVCGLVGRVPCYRLTVSLVDDPWRAVEVAVGWHPA